MRGISKPGLALLARKGIVTCGDLLERAPLRYNDRRKTEPLSSAREGESIFFSCTVTDVAEKRAKTGRDYLRVTVEDLSGLGARGLLMFFRGTDYISRQIRPGDQLAVLGRPGFQQDWTSGRSGGPVAAFPHPDFWNLREVGLDRLLGVFPVYGNWRGLSPGVRKTIIWDILSLFAGEPKILPETFLERHSLLDPTELVRILHDPPSSPGGRIPRSAKETRAYRTLAAWEIVFWRLMALREKGRRSAVRIVRPAASVPDLGEEFVSMLPFELSGEQARVLSEIRDRLALPSPANVLLQGEVGSGKTAVAAALLFRTAGEGRQSCLVAPTDLLARQHFEFLLPYAQRLGVAVELFAGSNTASRRRKAVSALASGDIRIAVGTQALLYPKLAFRDLALAVIDEQHRFGVKQRMALKEKSPSADLVSMSATPIPRSLALAFYGEMDVSSIYGTLPGRMQPEVEIFPPGRASEAYSRFADLLRSGERGFLVSPRIGEAERDADDDGADGGGSREGARPAGPDDFDRDWGSGGGFPAEAPPAAPPGARDPVPAPPGGGGPGRAAPPDATSAPGDRAESKGPSVAEMSRRLEALAPDIASGIIHGRLDSVMRSRVMEEFRAGKLQCLVSTTIVEVGVDIPGVNVMLIEGAENMGLAQLHQLRGRVGRGGGKARLMLLAYGNPTANAERRFEALKSGADGYALAELDLKLRGPGDELGLKQSGWPAFSFAKFPRDFKYLPRAFEIAADLFSVQDEFSDALAESLARLETDMASEALGV
jgi:ATP-dependent DNA helicase RecG